MNDHTFAMMFFSSLFALCGVALWVTGSSWPMLWLLFLLALGGEEE